MWNIKSIQGSTLMPALAGKLASILIRLLNTIIQQVLNCSRQIAIISPSVEGFWNFKHNCNIITSICQITIYKGIIVNLFWGADGNSMKENGTTCTYTHLQMLFFLPKHFFGGNIFDQVIFHVGRWPCCYLPGWFVDKKT